jgi:acyl-CoA synthetase (AMP-forming)/AMP-acid ligase II
VALGASIPALIERAAAWHADRVAVVDPTRSLTFREVDRRANRLANALLSFEPTPGARVALLMPNRAEFVEADFAIAKAGKVKLPINTRLSDAEREYLIENSGADTLVFDVRFAEFVEEARARLPALRHLVAIGGGASGAEDYEALLAKASDTAPSIQRDDESPSFLLYTSGTTGRPKGATSTQRSRRAATLSMLAEEIEADPGDAMVHVGAVAHGSGSKILAYFLRGARNILVPRWDPEAFLELVARERATGSFMVPTMMSALAEASRHSKADWSSLRAISYGGAPIAPAKLEEVIDRLGQVFVQVYGSCEAPHPLTVLPRAEHRVPKGKEARLASIGRETAQTELRLVDEAGNPVAPGEKGEMWVRGGHLMSGYWANPEATAEAFEGDWYRTGDVAYRDEDGYYYVVDRARDMVISGGLNVYPAEVEACLHRHPAVLETAVIGVPDEEWGESVKAVVVVRPGMSLSEAEVIEHCREHLAGYKKPRSVDFVVELPKGSTGKILKRDLRAPYWEGRERRV